MLKMHQNSFHLMNARIYILTHGTFSFCLSLIGLKAERNWDVMGRCRRQRYLQQCFPAHETFPTAGGGGVGLELLSLLMARCAQTGVSQPDSGSFLLYKWKLCHPGTLMNLESYDLQSLSDFFFRVSKFWRSCRNLWEQFRSSSVSG